MTELPPLRWPLGLNLPDDSTVETFWSRLLGKQHGTRTNALESLVISGWVRGLSDRDIEAALREAIGDDATVSESTVSRIYERI